MDEGKDWGVEVLLIEDRAWVGKVDRDHYR